MANESHFEFGGHRLVYDDYGSGKREVVIRRRASAGTRRGASERRPS